MTMRIIVKNGDADRIGTITQETFNIGEREPSHVINTKLGPGQEHSCYIHATSRLIITEDPEATINK